MAAVGATNRSSGKGGLILSEKSERAAEENDGIRQLIYDGTAMLGSGAGAAVGAVLGLLGGPGGAAVGGVAGKLIENLISKVGQEISERHLSTREKVRVGAAFTIAAAEIRQRIENGDSLREDGFFDEKQTGRSDAEEVAESVLLKAQREPEEKKIQYMGYLYASIPFDPEISAHVAHQLSKAAEQLTYRQLCILRLCAEKGNFGLPDILNLARDMSNPTEELSEVLHEYWDLYLRSFIDFGQGFDISMTEFGPKGMIPEMADLQGMGEDLYNLMRLSLIPDKDIAPIAEQLK